MHLLGEYARDDGRGDLLRQSPDGVASRLRRKLLRRHPHAEGLLAHLLSPKTGRYAVMGAMGQPGTW